LTEIITENLYPINHIESFENYVLKDRVLTNEEINVKLPVPVYYIESRIVRPQVSASRRISPRQSITSPSPFGFSGSGRRSPRQSMPSPSPSFGFSFSGRRSPRRSVTFGLSPSQDDEQKE
jgi:hypothetical protein